MPELPEDMPEEIKAMLRRIMESGGIDPDDMPKGLIFAGPPSELLEKIMGGGGHVHQHAEKYEMAWNLAWEARAVQFPDQDVAAEHIPSDMAAAQVGDFIYTHSQKGEQPFSGWIMDEADSRYDAEEIAKRKALNYICCMAITTDDLEAKEQWLYVPSMYVITPEQFAETKVWMELGFPKDLPDWLGQKYNAREDEMAERMGTEYARRRPCEQCGSRWSNQIMLSERYHRLGVPVIQSDETVAWDIGLTTPADAQDMVGFPVEWEQRAHYFCRACGFEREIDLSTEKLFVEQD